MVLLGVQETIQPQVGNIFEDSPLGLDKWMCAYWILCNSENGVSSCELARTLGVTQKSAWFMLHRIRTTLHDASTIKLSGQVEADELSSAVRLAACILRRKPVASLAQERRQDCRYGHL